MKRSLEFPDGSDDFLVEVSSVVINCGSQLGVSRPITRTRNTEGSFIALYSETNERFEELLERLRKS